MPTQEEYERTLEAAQGGILEFAFRTRVDAQKLCAEARRRVIREKNNLTRGISTRWREEFAKIKKENDEWQKALNAAFHAVNGEIGADLLEKYEALEK